MIHLFHKQSTSLLVNIISFLPICLNASFLIFIIANINVLVCFGASEFIVDRGSVSLLIRSLFFAPTRMWFFANTVDNGDLTLLLFFQPKTGLWSHRANALTSYNLGEVTNSSWQSWIQNKWFNQQFTHNPPLALKDGINNFFFLYSCKKILLMVHPDILFMVKFINHKDFYKENTCD